MGVWKVHESMEWMFVDLQWSNHLVFHVRSSLLGAWRLAKSSSKWERLFDQGFPASCLIPKRWTLSWPAVTEDHSADSHCLTTWNRVAFGCFSKYNLIQPRVEVGTGRKSLGELGNSVIFLESTSDLGNGWHPRPWFWGQKNLLGLNHQPSWMSVKSPFFLSLAMDGHGKSRQCMVDVPTQTSIFMRDLMLPLHIIATPDPVFHGMMPYIHLYTLVLIQLYNLRISKGIFHYRYHHYCYPRSSVS